MSEGFMYILECSNGRYYTGSAKDLALRMRQHQNGEGANFTKKHLPVRLVYYEKYHKIDDAFYREKQVQGWSRKKKEALITSHFNKLHELAECKNETNFRNAPFDSAQGTEINSVQEKIKNLNQKIDGTSSGIDRALSEVYGTLSGVETTTEKS